MTGLLLKTTLLSLPFGQLLSVSLGLSGFRIHLIDVLALIITIALVFNPISKKQIEALPLFKSLLFFIIAATLSLALSFMQNQFEPIIPAFLYLARFITYTAFLAAFVKSDQKALVPYFYLSGILFVSLGLIQYFLLPDARFLKFLGFDDHYYRLIGTFLDPNFTGAVLAVLAILSLGQKGKLRLLFLPVLLALALTFSRASYLSFGFGLLFLVISRKNYSLLVILVLLSILIYLIPKPFGEGVNLFRTFSIISRGQNLMDSFVLFTKYPILGVGFNTLKQTGSALIPNLTSGVDNSYLFVAVTTGIVGLAVFLKFLVASLKYQTNPTLRATQVVILTHSLFNNTFFYSWILILFFFLTGAGSRKRTLP